MVPDVSVVDVGLTDRSSVDRSAGCTLGAWTQVVPRLRRPDLGVDLGPDAGGDAGGDAAVDATVTPDAALDAAAVDAGLDMAVDAARPDARPPVVPDAGTFPAINGMFMVGASTMFLVGDRGTVITGFGTGTNKVWTRSSSTGTTANLRAVWAMSRFEAFAVGDGGTVIQTTDGVNWSPASFTTKPTENLRDVWGVIPSAGPSSPTWITAAGDRGRVVQAQRQGTTTSTWASWTSPMAGHAYRSVWSPNGTEVFLAGMRTVSSDASVQTRAAMALWRGGTTWIDLSPSTPVVKATIRRIRGRPSQRSLTGAVVTAVGDSGTLLQFTYSGVVSRRYGTWAVHPSGVVADLHAVHPRDDGAIVAVGDNRTVVQRTILGGATVLLRGGSAALTSMHMVGNELWVGGDDGVLLHSVCR